MSTRTGKKQMLTDRSETVATGERLHRFERGARWLLTGCFALFVLESAITAYETPATLGRSLLDRPPHILGALALACLSAGVPYSRLANHVALRVGALVLVCAMVAWVSALLLFLLFYRVVMSGFD